MSGDFDRIKQRLDLLTVITQETGLQMKGQHLEECPFCGGHDCFSIKGDFYKCFQCPSQGDVFNFLEAYHHIDRAQALKRAAELAGEKLTEHKTREIRLTARERIFIEAAEYYHSRLKSNGGSSYLIEARGHKFEILKKMTVGWTDGNLVEYLRTKGFTDEEIKNSGLAKEKQSDGTSFLVDYFTKGLAIFPHFERLKVLHFTIKHPQKTLKYQLSNESRSKEWRFYNQDALSKFNELLVIEGENDLLSVMDAGIEHVVGLIGQPADYQIKALKTYCVNKHLYLWLDNDKAGKNHIRKICGALHLTGYNARVIVYPEEFKDPDEYLRKHQGDRKKEIKRLQAEAIPYLTWEIAEASREETLESRINALKERGVFAAVAGMVEVEKIIYIEKIEALGLSRSAIDELLDINLDLKRELAVYLTALDNKRDADPNTIADMIFRHLCRTGKFFYDRMSNVYLLHQHTTYEIGNNRPFNSLMKRLTSLLPTKEPGRSVWESLASEAYSSGQQIDFASWIHTERTSNTVYVNLNGSNNIILKISKGGIEEIPNGLNKEGVLLKSSRKILPANFLPDADIREGMQDLKELIFDNLTCDKEQRYLILCWLFSAFLLDFCPYMGLMKFSGATSSGKTTAARLLSLLIYGNDHLGDSSAAAAYAVSSQNPLLIIDNLESEDFTKSILKFLLLSATKGGKEKRAQGTDSDTIQEQPKALVLITAIEPFTRAELINRTYDIEFSSRHKADSFIEDEVVRSLVMKRDLILSAVLKLISQEILPNLATRRDYITVLKKEYRNHSKNRTDEFLALLMLTLEKVLNYISYYQESDFYFGMDDLDIPPEDQALPKTYRAWIDYQNSKARDTEADSNSIIHLLDGMVRECLPKMKELEPKPVQDFDGQMTTAYAYTHPEYLIEMQKTLPEVVTGDEEGEYSLSFIDFVATSGEIVSAFSRYCRNNGVANPYASAAVFGSRLRNDTQILKKKGWELVCKPGIEPHFKILKGERFWRFRKRLVR